MTKLGLAWRGTQKRKRHKKTGQDRGELGRVSESSEGREGQGSTTCDMI